MTWYLIMLSIILLFGYLQISVEKKGYNAARLFLGLSCWMLFAFAAFRGRMVGADTKQYQDIFDWVKTKSIFELHKIKAPYWWDNTFGTEYTYKIYNKIISYFNSNRQIITIVNSVFIMFPIWMLIKKQSPYFWLSIFLFYTLGFYQTALNLTPSAIASLICLNALPLIAQKKPIQYFLIVSIAFLFHTSAYIFIPIYFLPKIKLNLRRFIIIMIVGFAISLIYTQMQGILLRITPAKYAPYVRSSSIKIEQLFVFAGHMSVFVFLLYFIKDKKEFFEKNTVGLYIFLIESILYFFTFYNISFSRAAFLFSPYLVILFPNMLMQINREQYPLTEGAKTRDKGVHAGVRNGYYLMVVALCIFQYIARIGINNIGRTMPYEFFFYS